MASGALGKLNILLGLDSTEFTSGLNKSEFEAKRSFEKLERYAARAATAFVAGAGVAAAGMVAWTRNIAETGKELDRFATLTNSSAETFQRWTYGAKTVGIEQEKLADILKDVQDRVGDFITTGGGPMADFFENVAPKVGVTAEQFRKLSGPEALGLFVSSLEKAGLSQAEMTFYMEAMASDSTLLLPLLRNNASGMKALGDEASRSGAVMRDETVAAAKQLDLELNRLFGSSGTLNNVLADALVPTLADATGRTNDFVDMILDAVNGTDDMRDAATKLAEFIGLKEWFDNVGMSVATTLDELSLLYDAVNVVMGGFENLFQKSREWLAYDAVDKTGIVALVNPELAKKQISEYNQVLQERNDTINKNNQKLFDLLDGDRRKFRDIWADSAGNPFDIELGGDVPVLGTNYISPSGGTGGTSKSTKTKTDTDPLGAFIKEQQEATSAYFSFIDEITGATESQRIEQQQRFLQDALDLGRISADQYATYMDEIANKGKETMDSLSVFGDQAARNIQDYLGTNLYRALKGDFDNILGGFVDMLGQMASQALAANIAGLLFGGSGNTTGSVGGIIGSLFRFDSGGYTGPGGKYEPAGIVHKGEGVLNQDEIRALGGETGFNALRAAIRGPGHATGGMGGKPALPSALISTPTRVESTPSAPTVNIYMTDSGSQVQAPAGMEKFGREVAQYVDARFRELQERSYRPGGLAWTATKGGGF